MELQSLENNLWQVKPASNILINKFEVISNKKNQFIFRAMEEFYDAAKPWLHSE